MTSLPAFAGLLISRDLFFTSKITGTAAAMEFQVDTVATVAAARDRIGNGKYRCLFLDLADATLNVDELMRSLPHEARPYVIAFGAHVATATLAAAEAAGCDEVLPRSKFSAILPQLLQRHLSGDSVSRGIS